MTDRAADKDLVLKALGVRLHRIRQAYGEMIHNPLLTAKQFAAALNVGEERYRTWERGLREMPLFMLVRIKHLTGASIDMILEGAVSSWDSDVTEADSAYHEQTIAMARRIRWVRQMLEPDIEKAAEVMRVICDRWRRWEFGIERPPMDKVAEFAVRFGVSIDFLWSGRLIGLDPNFEAALLERHEELRPPGYQPARSPYTHRGDGAGNSSPQSSASAQAAA